MTKLVISDETALWREGLAALLERDGTTIVVDKVGSAAALRTAVAEMSPDVVLVGVSTAAPGRERTMALIDSMRLDHPGIGMLMLSDEVDPALAVRLISRRPASMGYILKQPIPDPQTLVRAVRVTAAGGTFVDRSVIERLRSARFRPASLECLTGRERGILALMAEGRSNSAMCDRLCLSPKTVETHVRAIFNKLQLRAAPHDHRRVLAVLRYLQVDVAGEKNQPPAAAEPNASGRVSVASEHAA